MKKIIVYITCLIPLLNFAQQLPRKGWLGAKVKIEETGGAKIQQIIGGTSSSASLKADDLILKINNIDIKELKDISNTIGGSLEGKPVTFEIVRNNKKQTIKSKILGRDRESNEVTYIIYESVPFKNGKLSVIINKPKSKGKHPAVLFIPGYTCSSVDALPKENPYAKIVKAFADAGFVVLRVEKSGLGDSQNTPDCKTTNLLDEVESFQAGFNKMKSLDYVDENNLFVFGHSMGGVIAPAISAKNKVAGTIVYGTTAKSWFEYTLELNRLQLKLAKAEPLEYEQSCRIQCEIAYEYYIQKKSLKEIASDPQKAAILKTDWQYDGNDMIYDRNQEYWRQIQDYPLLENWKNVSGKVLVLFGESDFQAFSKPDHEQIVNTVNYFKPNSAELMTFPETDHYFAKSGTMQNAFDMYV